MPEEREEKKSYFSTEESSLFNFLQRQRNKTWHLKLYLYLHSHFYNSWMVQSIASNTVQFLSHSMACKEGRQWLFLRKESTQLNLNIYPFFWKKWSSHRLNLLLSRSVQNKAQSTSVVHQNYLAWTTLQVQVLQDKSQAIGE